jgi:hypothetical protein
MISVIPADKIPGGDKVPGGEAGIQAFELTCHCEEAWNADVAICLSLIVFLSNLTFD